MLGLANFQLMCMGILPLDLPFVYYLHIMKRTPCRPILTHIIAQVDRLLPLPPSSPEILWDALTIDCT